jgi:hypothetical protein
MSAAAGHDPPNMAALYKPFAPERAGACEERFEALMAAVDLERAPRATIVVHCTQQWPR